jgi:hypothetical protein
MSAVSRVGLLVALVLVGTACAGGHAGRTLGGYGVSLSLPRGWSGLTASGELQAADFPLPRSALGSAESVRVRRGHVHLIVWDLGPSVPYLRNFPSARAPVSVRRRDLSGALEGFPSEDVFAVRTVTLGEELLELVVDLGPKPLAAGRLRELNRVLATVRVRSPRILQPHAARLAGDGISVRLPAGWSGRLEVPAGRRATRLVLRARRGQVRLVLLELPGGGGRHADLPVVLTGRDVFRRHGLRFARRVFTNGGRSFDLTATVATGGELTQVNRLLATLRVVPRPWTFRSCDLSLRLPGTWWAAIKPRDRCYPVITLRGPGIRVVLTELRPQDRASGRTLRRSGRRFVVVVTPPTAESQADPVLATLRAAPRS